ncbi:GNAT family N-acetyltransferase [Arthrobacter sp. TMN-49]
MSHRLVAIEAGDGFSFGLFSGETVVGRFNLAGIARGPFQSGVLSYWVDRDYTGRGLVSAAVQVVVEKAREELGLHRIEAATLLHNAGSQRVLLKAGFQQIGMAPRYLQIAGTWQDHNLYQILLSEEGAGAH